MTWRDRPMMGMDSESTGVNVETDRLVTVCIGLATSKGWTARTWLFTQADEIPAEATAVHRITTDYANEHGTDPRTNLIEIEADLQRGWRQNMPAVLYNAPFDLTLLDRELRRHDLPPLQINGFVVDPLVIDKAIDRFRRGSRKLIDVAAHYGIELDEAEAHGAEADTRAACRLAWKMATLVPTPPGRRDPLDFLHEWQQVQYAEQRRSFADYLAKQGKSLDDPSTAWPLKPFPIFEPHPVMEQTDLLDPDLEPAPF